MPEHERAMKAKVVATELASQVDVDQLRAKLADATLAPGALYRFGDAVWNAQAGPLLARFVGDDVADLHDEFLRKFVRVLELRLAEPAAPH